MQFSNSKAIPSPHLSLPDLLQTRAQPLAVGHGATHHHSPSPSSSSPSPPPPCELITTISATFTTTIISSTTLVHLATATSSWARLCRLVARRGRRSAATAAAQRCLMNAAAAVAARARTPAHAWRHRRRHRRCGRRRPPSTGARHPWLPSHGGHRPPGRAVEAIRAFCTTSRRDELGNDAEITPRRSNFVRDFPEIRPLDRRFLCSIAISFYGANFVSLYLLHRSSVWRATSSGAKLDSVASVGPPYTYQLFRLSRRIAWRCLLA
ncbi:putative extensin [Iris pallida]|uniref:Extensin n=1 Tax=Iris pallida TaxID=29817 RepID=A0AAX6GMC8_IRIPA|nr:putative extensin [Iris pallida]